MLFYEVFEAMNSFLHFSEQKT